MPGGPVLLIHGLQSGPSTWWRVGADLTTLGFEVATPTLPGHAGRPIPPGASLADLADAVAPAGPAVVVGHSLGALVALELAARRPDLVRALVLEDPPSRQVADPAALAPEVLADAAAARADPEGLRARLLIDHPAWASADAQHAVLNRAAVDVDRATDPLGADWSLLGLVAASPVPFTLLLADTGSAVAEDDRAPLLAAASSSIVVESGHAVHRDRPGVWVAVVAAAAGALPSGPGRPGA